LDGLIEGIGNNRQERCNVMPWIEQHWVRNPDGIKEINIKGEVYRREVDVTSIFGSYPGPSAKAWVFFTLNEDMREMGFYGEYPAKTSYWTNHVRFNRSGGIWLIKLSIGLVLRLERELDDLAKIRPDLAGAIRDCIQKLKDYTA
jgi:hypothetical protein